MQLKLVGLMNLMLILAWPINIQEREPNIRKQNSNKQINKQTNKEQTKKIWLAIGHTPTDFFQNWYLDRETKLYSLIPVRVILTFIQGHTCMRN